MLEEDDQCNALDGSDCSIELLQFRSGRGATTGTAEVASAEGEAHAVTASEFAEAVAEADRLQSAQQQAETMAENHRRQLPEHQRYNVSAFGGRLAPAIATQYNGLPDQREFIVHGDENGVSHIFAVGDWGATMPGHYTAPNTRGHGRQCPQNCGYVHGIDNRAQLLVANAMRDRAARFNPQYVLNPGDNFYWAGIPEGCGSTGATDKTFKSFSDVWSGVYGDLTDVPWISALGNHDYGGRQFNDGWPQQIGYSFVNKNWVMPGRNYHKVMNHPNFTVEYFVIDSNAYDAKDPEHDPEHNICSRMHNPWDANCAHAGGPSSVNECKSWFWSTYNQQKAWLKTVLAASTADWQVVITHFPCGHDAGFYRHLRRDLGLDLLVTGHRHQQELWSNSGILGGLTCFVSGGGGGITSERPPAGMGDSQYGFFDISISKEKMRVQSIAMNGKVIGSSWVYPVDRRRF